MLWMADIEKRGVYYWFGSGNIQHVQHGLKVRINSNLQHNINITTY